MVGVVGFEPTTFCSQSRRASHCATPRFIMVFPGGIEPLGSFRLIVCRRIRSPVPGRGTIKFGE